MVNYRHFLVETNIFFLFVRYYMHNKYFKNFSLQENCLMSKDKPWSEPKLFIQILFNIAIVFQERKKKTCREKGTFCLAPRSGSPWCRLFFSPFHASVSLSSECVRRGLLACLLLLACCEITSSPSHNITTHPLFFPFLCLFVPHGAWLS